MRRLNSELTNGWRVNFLLLEEQEGEKCSKQNGVS